MTIIFPHVPKAGGTSIKVQLEKSDINVLLDYKAPPGDSSWHAQKKSVWDRRLSWTDLESYDLVFGHFPVTRYVGNGYRYIALVRDPVERTISQYFYHIHRAGLPHLKPNRKRFYQAVASGRIGFLDYCRRTNCANIYKLHLDRWDRDKFLLIGDTSRYGEFVENFNRLLGTELTDNTHLRRREETPREISASEIAELKVMLKDEIEWYQRFTATG